MDASSRAQATSGVSALAQLPLVSFLSASPSPSLVLALAPLVDCLAAQPGLVAFSREPPPPAVQTPLWDGKAHHYPLTPVRPHPHPGLAPTSVYDDAAMSPAEGLRGMVEQLNVKTPGRDPRDSPTTSTTAATDASRPADYFSLATAPTAPPVQLSSTAAEPSPSVSLASTASSSAATLVSSTSTAATLTGGKTTPPTPLEDDLAHEDSLFSFTVGGGDAADDDDDDALDQLAEALHPVYRNEAWRSIENKRPQRPGPGPRETSSSTLRPYNPAAQHARAEVRRTRERASNHRRSKGKGNSTGASALRHPTAEEDLLLDSLPAAPGFENKPKRLGTVEEEEYQDDLDSRGDRPEFMDTTEGGEDDGGEEDDDEEFPSACASEVETEVDPDSDAYRFLSPVEQRQLLLFLLELVVDSDVLTESGAVTPDPRSPQASPRIERQHGTYSPRETPSSSTYRDSPRRVSVSMNRKPVQCCTLGDYDLTATLILTPPPPGAPPTQGKPPPSGFIILTTPPPRTPPSPQDPMLPQAWPSGTGTGLAARPTAIPLSPDSLFAAGPLAQPGETGHVYEAPSAETVRTVPRARRGSRRNSESEGSLDADQKWMRALGDGEMSQRIRSHDWSQTSLGPISGWCAELRSGVASILASPFRECILWGEDMAIVYNDLYIATAGDKHPALLGLPAREGWKEIWDGLNSVAQKTLMGETCYFKDHFLAMERLGFVEETCTLPCSSCLGTIVCTHARRLSQTFRSYLLVCSFPQLGWNRSWNFEPVDRVSPRSQVQMRSGKVADCVLAVTDLPPRLSLRVV